MSTDDYLLVEMSRISAGRGGLVGCSWNASAQVSRHILRRPEDGCTLARRNQHPYKSGAIKAATPALWTIKIVQPGDDPFVGTSRTRPAPTNELSTHVH